MPMFSSFVPLLLFIAASANPVNVIDCGADPSGNIDSTKAFNLCLAAVPAGTLFVPAGRFKISGSILKNRNQNIIGAGSRASVLLCQSDNSACVVTADTSGGVNNYTESRLEDLTLQGLGPDSKGIGIYLGGDPSGRVSSQNSYGDGACILNLRITGFRYGVTWGNNSWGNKLTRSLIFGNSIGLYVPSGLTNSGENIRVSETDIFNNRDFGIDDHGNFEWSLSGTSFDYNGTAIEFFGSSVHISNAHFEQSGGRVLFQPYGSGDLSMRDSTILVQGNNGSDKYILSIWPQILEVVIENVSVWSNHPIEYFMHMGGDTRGAVRILYGNGNRMIHSFANLPGNVTFENSYLFDSAKKKSP